MMPAQTTDIVIVRYPTEEALANDHAAWRDSCRGPDERL